MKSDQNFTLYKTHKVSLESEMVMDWVVQTPWNYSSVFHVVDGHKFG